MQQVMSTKLVTQAKNIGTYNWALFSYSATTCLVVAGLVALGLVLFNGAVGINDFAVFLFWSLFFAGIVAVLAVWLIRLVDKLPFLLRYLLALFMGATLGILWTVSIALLLGPWFAAFSFAVMPCWVSAGACGALVPAMSRTDTKITVGPLDLIIIIAIILFTVSGTSAITTTYSTASAVSITFMKWIPGSQPLRLDGANDPEGP